MKPHIVISTGVLLLAVHLCGCVSVKNTPPRGAVINDSLAFRSIQEERQTEARALAGDDQAALRLGEHSFLVKEDLAKAKYWYRLAASRGNKTAKENLDTLSRIDPKEWATAHKR